MKGLRWAIPLLVLILSGCSTMTTGPSESPLMTLEKNKTTEPLHVSMAGVAPFSAATPFTVEAIQKLLPGYTVKSIGIGADGIQEPGIAVSKNNQLLVTLYPGHGLDRVFSVIVESDSIIKDPRLLHGGRFGQLLVEQNANCLAGLDELAGKVICQVPASQGMVYIFSGQWQGPDGEMPPAKVLRDWRVTRLVWFPHQ